MNIEKRIISLLHIVNVLFYPKNVQQISQESLCIGILNTHNKNKLLLCLHPYNGLQ